MLRKLAIFISLAMALPASLQAQEKARLDILTFHSSAMEGNLEGNSADRDVFVVTPPGYDENPQKHYPVVYFLHGFFATPQMYQDMMKFDELIDQAASLGNEVILVMPDGHSKYGGGMYSSSPTTGNYEAMVAQDLVAWVDASFRTIPEAASRGLSGHSMGGYGTLRIAMKNPDVFSSIYVMSACCLVPQPLSPESAAQVEAMSAEQMEGAEFAQLAPLASLSVWSPDPSNPPHYWDTGLREGAIDPLVIARFAANAPVAMLPQYLPALSKLEAIRFDIGDQDFLLEPNKVLKAQLERYGVKHGWEYYEGDHGNRIAARLRSHVLPFFGEQLDRQSD